MAELEKLREEVSAKKRDLDLARVQYDQRSKIRDERTTMLDSIKEQVEKLRIMHDDPTAPKVRLVGNAPVPLEMVTSRKWWVHFPGGTILGLLVAVGLSFLIELLNDLVRTPRDISRYLHIPLLSVITDKADDDQVRGIEPAHIVRQAPYSMTSECYRQLRTHLKLSNISAKVILVSSGSAGDGKTSVAVNLASTFVAESKKVLLIDANFRRPNLQSLLPRTAAANLEAEHYDFGLSNVLMNQCAAKDAIRTSGVEYLDIIDSGPLPPNPGELLGSARMENLLKEQREKYDYIVIDSPPVLLVSDSRVLAKFADETVLVFNSTSTRRGAAQRTIDQLKEVGANIAGCVLFVRVIKGGYFEEQIRLFQEYQKVQPAAVSA
jgi:capsular exopolysaccharide synthesis family protein